jgi:hypothetical protein
MERRILDRASARIMSDVRCVLAGATETSSASDDAAKQMEAS